MRSGYTFSFPFLSVDCGLSLEDMYSVQPLYKHLININRPTMAIVGLQICAYSYMYDLQVLYYIIKQRKCHFKYIYYDLMPRHAYVCDTGTMRSKFRHNKCSMISGVKRRDEKKKEIAYGKHIY